jgi:hypothetical protein
MVTELGIWITWTEFRKAYWFYDLLTEYQADFIEWHPSGALLVVLNNKGELQVNILQLDINNI